MGDVCGVCVKQFGLFYEHTSQMVYLTRKQLHKLKVIFDAAYKDNSTSECDLGSLGYSLDRELSGSREKVFVDRDGDPYVVFRGTVHNLGDEFGRFLAGVGRNRYDKRLAHSFEKVKKVKRKYKKRNLTVMGHSLGGYMAEKVHPKGDVITYNKYSLGDPVTNKQQIDIRTSTDMVSMRTPPHKNMVVLPGRRDLFKSHEIECLMTPKEKVARRK